MFKNNNSYFLLFKYFCEINASKTKNYLSQQLLFELFKLRTDFLPVRKYFQTLRNKKNEYLI